MHYGILNHLLSWLSLDYVSLVCLFWLSFVKTVYCVGHVFILCTGLPHMLHLIGDSFLLMSKLLF